MVTDGRPADWVADAWALACPSRRGDEPVPRHDRSAARLSQGVGRPFVRRRGRVFAYGDEWVALPDQWVSTGNPPNRQTDPYNACYHMASDAGSSDPNNYFYSVVNFYQSKQFWYDAINWVAPPSQCTFVIVDKDVKLASK